jgi:hypothetical protein
VRNLAAILTAAILATPAMARDPWSTQDKALEGAFIAGKIRTVWQCAWIDMELGTVERNYRLGIRLNF